MTLLLILAALVFAILLGIFQFATLRRMKRALAREDRAITDRDEVVTFLNRFSETLVLTNDPNDWLRTVASNVAKAIGARALLIYNCDEQDNLVLVAKVGELPALADRQNAGIGLGDRLLRELSQPRLRIAETRLGGLAYTGQRCLENPGADRPLGRAGEAQQIDTFMAVPMSLDASNVAIICAVNKQQPHSRFTNDDLLLLEAISHQVALGTNLVTMYKALSDQRIMERELALAAEIQKSLLPAHPPPGRRLKIEAVNIPASQVSGDFYDFIALDEDTMLVVIADASGKGVPACLLMGMCRSFLRANAQRYKSDLEGLLRELNANLYADTEGHQYITFACCLVDKKDNTIEYARAGHTDLLVRSDRGDVRVISPDGTALGLLPPEMDPPFETFAFAWPPGSSILLYTDGISEALSPEGEEFGTERLIEVWRQLPLDPAEASHGIIAEVQRFTHGAAQYDDQTLVVLSRSLEAEPRSTVA